MNKLLAGLVLLVVSSAVYATCTTDRFMSDDGIVICTNCCDSSGNCSTRCY